jgi:uncharacterized membrane protein YphA (DoxX/SURF4 family)
MFPSRSAGLALLVLRCTVVFSLLYKQLFASAETSSYVVELLVISAIAISLGLLTPYFAIVLIVLQGFSACARNSGNVEQSIELALYLGVLTVLGPGAYSFDALLFGRRLVQGSDRRR